jgi:hypothetical protein
MINQLTNEQVARVLYLCGEISKVQRELPAAPRGFEVSLEVATHLRASLEAKNAILVELGALLRPESSPAAE